MLCERTYARGAQRWKVDHKGNWQTLMFGSTPYSNGNLIYTWQRVDIKDVPDDLLKEAND